MKLGMTSPSPGKLLSIMTMVKSNVPLNIKTEKSAEKLKVGIQVEINNLKVNLSMDRKQVFGLLGMKTEIKLGKALLRMTKRRANTFGGLSMVK